MLAGTGWALEQRRLGQARDPRISTQLRSLHLSQTFLLSSFAPSSASEHQTTHSFTLSVATFCTLVKTPLPRPHLHLRFRAFPQLHDQNAFLHRPRSCLRRPGSRPEHQQPNSSSGHHHQLHPIRTSAHPSCCGVAHNPALLPFSQATFATRSRRVEARANFETPS